MSRKRVPVWVFAFLSLLCIGALLTVRWPMSVVVGSLEDYPYVSVSKFQGGELIDQADLDGAQARAVIAVLEETRVKFVRKGEGFAYDGSIPRYDITVTGDNTVLGTIRVNGTYLHFRDWHYSLSEETAVRLNEVLASCFS